MCLFIDHTRNIFTRMLIFFFFVLLSAPNVSYGGVDRAIERAKEAQQEIERTGKPLSEAVKSFGEEAAPIARELARIIAENNEKVAAGLITQELQFYYDAQKLNAISKMKQVSDKHFPSMLATMDGFDNVLVESVSNMRSAAGITKDYEFEFKKKKETIIRDISAKVQEQQQIVKEINKKCEENRASIECKGLHAKFDTINRRIQRDKRKIKYAEMDLKISQQNQGLAKLIGLDIKTYGAKITEDLRMTLFYLYKEFESSQDATDMIGTQSVSAKIARLAKDAGQFWGVLRATSNQTSGIIENVIDSFGNMGNTNEPGTGSVTKSHQDILAENQQFLIQQRQ